MISVIGSGKWGSAIAHAISLNNKVNICPFNKKDGDYISIDEAKKSEYLVFALSAQGTYDYLKTNFASINNNKVLIASKGIYEDMFLHDIFSKFFHKENICVLTGPSFAAEVSKNLPTALVISGINENLNQEFAAFFPNFIKTYTDTDVIGAEICGAYKNIIAIASGICDGLELGNNARAALISRGLIEITRFGKFFGARDNTFLGLSGAGDLFLTASSTLSRNYRVGLMLAKGYSKEQIYKELQEVAEGIATTKSVCKIAKTNNIYCPIANEISLILDGKDVKISLQDLLKR
ncbi:glycerol-3-phosphate dehydrogenase [Campylobacter sp. RM5004]|uniref:NAD(P)H-dependent glycerol-3-phosphate dehydrogenase n=1 Tax=Campylobacter sp. RM5004 TaxID=1660078 RepID=UPI001EFAE0E8|nr:NAD(P)H-dependent glycerol-3-phosphate dehydrogenase [Campylobacter sp. RM5004]ULO02078.1 glycerol-3-phosphate dehydrogenase [Campylobacter sp. RM5004]